MNEETIHRIMATQGAEPAAADLPLDALSLGRGVFETVLVLGGRAVLGGRHQERLARSCEELEITSAQQARRLFKQAVEIAAREGPARARLRLAVFADSGRPPVGLLAVREAPEPPAAVKLNIAGCRRRPGCSTVVHKSASYLENLTALQEARRRGFDDALFLDEAGDLAETAVANLFLITGDELRTPPEGSILPGVVRAWVLEEAARLGVKVDEGEIPAAELGRADAAFVTNSIKGLVPVARAGDTVFVEPGRDGTFRTLLEAYEELLESTSQA